MAIRRRNLSSPLAVSEFDDDKPKRKKRKTNRAIDKEDKRIRKEKISKQLADKGTYSVDVSGERKVKKKLAKLKEKSGSITEKKDARQKKLVKAGLRRETKKNQLLQKKLEVQKVEGGKKGKFGTTNKTKVPKDPSVKRKTKAKKEEATTLLKRKDRGGRDSRRTKPIRRGIQINRSKTGGGGKRRSNNAIQKGKSIFGKNKKI